MVRSVYMVSSVPSRCSVGSVCFPAVQIHACPFAVLQDQLKLLRCCVKAMKTNNTSDRLEVVQGHMQNSLNTLAAKCALKALNLG